MPRDEVKVCEAPSDGVSAVRWDSSSRLLLASSWDSTVRLYDPFANVARTKIAQPSAVLDCDFVGDAERAVSGGLDGIVRLHGLSSGGETVLGSHDSAVRCVRHCAAAGPSCVVSGSWDHALKLWDVRAAEACVSTFKQPDKILSMCAGAHTAAAAGAPLLVVATAGRRIMLIDLRKPTEALQQRESSLKCQTRCVAQMPSGEGYTIGSVEGRVAVEYVDPSEEAQKRRCAGAHARALHTCHRRTPPCRLCSVRSHAVCPSAFRRYAFKGHKLKIGDVDTSFPVNAIAFHPQHGTFATGGCDGHVYVWDGNKKKRICALKRYPTSISSLAFSPDGESLAVASSYTYENGDVAHPPDEIYVRSVSLAEVKSKSSSKDKEKPQQADKEN